MDGVGLLSIWVLLTFLLGSGLFLGGSALLYNWVWLSLGLFGGVELYLCADPVSFLLGSALLSTWVWLSFGRFWLTFYLGLAYF